jgi:hypothetical protein
MAPKIKPKAKKKGKLKPAKKSVSTLKTEIHGRKYKQTKE